MSSFQVSRDWTKVRYERWLCQNCGRNPTEHIARKCLFAPTQQLIVCRVHPADTYPVGSEAQIYCCACVRYTLIPVHGQTLTQCPNCAVDFVPCRLWAYP